jgi:hypothetical protein
MSRTQQKLQAMSAQELLIQEKKRMIEEKMRLDNAKKSHNDCKLSIYSKKKLMHSYEIFLATNQHNSNNIFKNDGSFLEQFQKTQGQLSTLTNQNNDTRQVRLQNAQIVIYVTNILVIILWNGISSNKFFTTIWTTLVSFNLPTTTVSHASFTIQSM